MSLFCLGPHLVPSCDPNKPAHLKPLRDIGLSYWQNQPLCGSLGLAVKHPWSLANTDRQTDTPDKQTNRKRAGRQGRAGQGRARQSRAGQGRARQGRAGQSRQTARQGRAGRQSGQAGNRTSQPRLPTTVCCNSTSKIPPSKSLHNSIR